MRTEIKEETSGFDEFFSDFKKKFLLQNGGHLDLRNFLNLYTIDMPQMGSRFSGLRRHTDSNED